MISFNDLKTKTRTDVLLEKQIGSMESGEDAPSIYTINDFDYNKYNLEIIDCAYDGYTEGSAIYDKDFSKKNPLIWSDIKEKCFSEKWHTDISEHEKFINMLNSMT